MCNHRNKCCHQPQKNEVADTIKTIVSLPFVLLVAIPLWLCN